MLQLRPKSILKKSRAGSGAFFKGYRYGANQLPKICSAEVTDLSREEADVFPFNVLPEGHLEQGQAHVQCLNNVALPTARNLEYRYKTKIKQWREYRYGTVGTYVQYTRHSHRLGGGGGLGGF